MRSALSFLTPFGRASTPGARTMEWFAVVGIVIGLAVAGVWWAAWQVFPPIVAGALAVGADALFTGGLHLDGLADAADGLLPPLPAERRLDVMRDSAVGAFGVVALVVVLVLRFASFSATTPAVLAVAGIWGLSRAAMAVIAWTMPYARPQGGLATAFVGSDESGTATRPGARSGVILGAGIGACVLLGIVGDGLHGLAALATTAVGCGAVALFARARIGGFTGDVLGAAGVIGETLGLVVLSAHP